MSGTEVTSMDLTTCPECGAPAEVRDRHVLESTDGPIEHARIRCVQRHYFFLPVEQLSSSSGTPVRRTVRSTWDSAS
jgi:hypothetical protein